MINITKEKYLKIKEIILYLFGISFFINFDIAKVFFHIMFIFLLIDIFYFKEKLTCGNDNLKKFIIFLVFGGIIWNFCADFNYKAARAYFKINRYFILVFYLYPLIKYKKEILRNFLISLLSSYTILFIQGINFYNTHKHLNYYRLDVFEGVMDVALLVAVVGAFSFGQIIENKSKKYKIINSLVLCMTIFLLMITQTRAALLAIIVSIIGMIIISKNLKVILISLVSGILVLVCFLQMPQAERFKSNTFNIKVTTNNMSNGLRVEMWKNAIWRFKQHPIMGSGTKQDYKLFAEYVKNMPEKTETQKVYKKIFEKGFDDAHSMYLNLLTDNGVFSFFQFSFILLILPFILIKNKDYEYRISLLGSLIVFSVYGLVWPLWRHSWNPMLLWCIVALIIISNLEEMNKKS